MKNEIYGEITLGVKMPVSANNERLAMLEAHYKVSNEITDIVDIVAIDHITGRVHKIDIIDWNIKWQRFFREDEVV